MEDKSKQPDYPCIDLSITDWNDEEFDSVIFWDERIYTMKETIVEKYFLNHVIIDCKGEIFKIVGVENLASWRRFVPLVAKKKVIAEYTGRKMTLEEFRAYMLGKVDSMHWPPSLRDVLEKWRVEIIGAQNYLDMMG